MRSERIENDPDGIADRWALDADLACMLVHLQRRASEIWSSAVRGGGLPPSRVRFPDIYVISGYRSPTLQAQINSSAPRSLHTRKDRCGNPASLAVDLRLGNLPATTTPPEVWAWLGGIWKSLGGRWGGDFSTPDFNHFDTGEIPPAVTPIATER